MERRLQQEQEQNQNVDQRAEQNRAGQERECKSRRDPEKGVSELDPDLPCALTNLPLRFPGISGNKLPLWVEKQSFLGLCHLLLQITTYTHETRKYDILIIKAISTMDGPLRLDMKDLPDKDF